MLSPPLHSLRVRGGGLYEVHQASLVDFCSGAMVALHVRAVLQAIATVEVRTVYGMCEGAEYDSDAPCTCERRPNQHPQRKKTPVNAFPKQHATLIGALRSRPKKRKVRYNRLVFRQGRTQPAQRTYVTPLFAFQPVCCQLQMPSRERLGHAVAGHWRPVPRRHPKGRKGRPHQAQRGHRG